jgi:hypothetical protein
MTKEDSEFVDVLDQRTQELFKKYKESIEENVSIRSEFFALYDTVLHFLETLGVNKQEIIAFQNRQKEFYYSEQMIAVEDADPELAAELDQTVVE